MPGVNPQGGERWVAEGGIAMVRLGTAARLAAWSGQKRAIMAVAPSLVVSACSLLSRNAS